MFLTTKCNQCVFNSNPGCLLEKDVEEMMMDGHFKDQRTIGFCNCKRTFNWYEGKQVRDLDNAKNIVELEEFGIGILIILDNDKDEKAIAKTIQSIVDADNAGMFRSFRMIGQKINKDKANSLVKIAKEAVENKGSFIDWHIDNILLDDEILVDDFIHHSFGKITEHWFITLLSGETFSKDDVKNIKTFMDNRVKNNLLCLYFDDDNHTKVLTNKFAFQEMQGNIDSKFIDKVKIFDNWKTQCILSNADMSQA